MKTRDDGSLDWVVAELLVRSGKVLEEFEGGVKSIS